jgi:hypothetical protein
LRRFYSAILPVHLLVLKQQYRNTSIFSEKTAWEGMVDMSYNQDCSRQANVLSSRPEKHNPIIFIATKWAETAAKLAGTPVLIKLGKHPSRWLSLQKPPSNIIIPS